MSPWALALTEPVPEAFELPASDWPEKNFWPISEEEQPRDSDVSLHNVVFLIDRFLIMVLCSKGICLDIL